MSNVLRLPTGTERFWRTELAPTFRSELIGAGVPIRAVNWILADFEPRFLAAFREHRFEILVPENYGLVAQQVLSRFREMQDQQMIEAVREMLKLEADLYVARFGPLSPGVA
jgi:hypothetical protein